MFDVKEISVAEILVEDRIRQDYGDLTELEDDIKRLGLLYPLLINEKKRLLDGERRLICAKKLKWATIPCRIIPGLQPDDLIFIEWLGNRRKNFTWVEELEIKWKLHKYWESKNPTWSYRASAEKLNISLGGLSTDLTLAAALEVFPELKDNATKGKAREAYKKLQSTAQACEAINSLTDDEQARIEAMLNGTTAKNLVDSVDLDLQDPEVLAHLSAKLAEVESKTTDKSQPADPETPQSMPDSDSRLPAFSYEICSYRDFVDKIPNNSVGFAELDPPYAIDFNNVYGKCQDVKSAEADWSFEELLSAMDFLLPALWDKLLDRSWVAIWTGHEHSMWINEKALKVGFGIQKPCIWKKPSGYGNSPSTTAISNYETLLLLRKGNATFNTPSFLSAFDCPTVPASQRAHQWEKHMDVYRNLFRSMAKPGSLFLSPFAGSGNSMVVASLFNMTPMGCDINKTHFYAFYKKYKNHHMEE